MGAVVKEMSCHVTVYHLIDVLHVSYFFSEN